MLDLKQYIEDNNISQIDMANRMKYSQTYINKVLNGAYPLNVKFLAKFNACFPQYALNRNQVFLVEEEPVPYGKALPELSHDPNGRKIPAFEGQAFATISPAMGDVVTLRPDTFVRIPMFSQGEFAVQVTGHSMKPYISHGDWAVIKRITNRDAVIYGEPYLIITKSDQLKTVKFLKAGDEPETFWLVPYNVEQFEPQEIDKSEVLELYRVVGIFRTV